MSGKLFIHRLAPGLGHRLGVSSSTRAWAWIAVTLPLMAAGGGCRGDQRVLTRPAALVEAAVRPDRFAPGLRKLGRSHYRSVARFEAGPDGAPMEEVNTETDVWLDDHGNWRLVELNDKDGGREIVLHGRELSVALRYGKMIRRPAEDPEPQHLLEEGVGAPFAAWELLRNIATVDDFGDEDRAGRKVHIFKVTKSPKPAQAAALADRAGDRRAWRQTVVADNIDGTIVVDEASELPLQIDFRAQYRMRRPAIAGRGPSAGAAGSAADAPAQGQGSDQAGTPMHGAVIVHAAIEDIGRSPLITRPEAEDLPLRQRTVPDEKALLVGLPRSAAPPPAPIKPATSKGGRGKPPASKGGGVSKVPR